MLSIILFQILAMQNKYTIEVDFGTDSVRALIVNRQNVEID
jgi:ribulose kinase